MVRAELVQYKYMIANGLNWQRMPEEGTVRLEDDKGRLQGLRVDALSYEESCRLGDLIKDMTNPNSLLEGAPFVPAPKKARTAKHDAAKAQVARHAKSWAAARRWVAGVGKSFRFADEGDLGDESFRTGNGQTVD